MAVGSKKVFVAPSVFFAFVDRAHPKHEQATAFFRYFAQAGYFLFTDIETIVETYRQLYRHISASLAKDFLRTIFLSNLNILYPDEGDIKAGIKALVSYQSTDLTFPKALMAVFANRRGIPQICTFEYLHSLFGLTLFYLPM